MRRPFFAGAVALILVSWGCGQRLGARALPPLPRGVTAEISELPYTVRGTTVDEIRMSLLAAASAALGGSSRVGLHRSSVRLEYQYVQQGSYCEMTDVTIEVESAIQVPRWADRGTADSELVRTWGTYIAALRGHEYTHREYLYRQARDISRELYRIESPTCDSIESMANSAIGRVNEQYARLNEQFDEENGTIAWPPGQ